MSKNKVVQIEIKVRFLENRVHSHSKIVKKKIKIGSEMSELLPFEK